MLALLALHAVMGQHYAAVWVSDVTLWRRAVSMAPGKWRPMMNLEKAQAAR